MVPSLLQLLRNKTEKSFTAKQKLHWKLNFLSEFTSILKLNPESDTVTKYDHVQLFILHSIISSMEIYTFFFGQKWL